MGYDVALFVASSSSGFVLEEKVDGHSFEHRHGGSGLGLDGIFPNCMRVLSVKVRGVCVIYFLIKGLSVISTT